MLLNLIQQRLAANIKSAAPPLQFQLESPGRAEFFWQAARDYASFLRHEPGRRGEPAVSADYPLRCNPVFLRSIAAKLDTSVTFYSGIPAAIIPVWQRRRAYVRSRVARLRLKERFLDAGSGTGSTFLFGSFILMTGQQK